LGIALFDGLLRFRFLDACTSLAQTVLKLLEVFSQDQRLYIKSKRQKKRSTNTDVQEDGSNSEDEDQPTARKRVAEKAFQFQLFEAVCYTIFQSEVRNL